MLLEQEVIYLRERVARLQMMLDKGKTTADDPVAISEIVAEWERAVCVYPNSFASSHEGWAILREEVDELWDEVKRKDEYRSVEMMRKEAIQVGAMAVRFIEDVCG